MLAACWNTYRTNPLQSKPVSGEFPPYLYLMPVRLNALTNTSCAVVAQLVSGETLSVVCAGIAVSALVSNLGSTALQAELSINIVIEIVNLEIGMGSSLKGLSLICKWLENPLFSLFKLWHRLAKPWCRIPETQQVNHL